MLLVVLQIYFKIFQIISFSISAVKDMSLLNVEACLLLLLAFAFRLFIFPLLKAAVCSSNAGQFRIVLLQRCRLK